MEVADEAASYLEVVATIDTARRVLSAYDAGRLTAGSVAWALEEAGRRIDRATRCKPAWLQPT